MEVAFAHSYLLLFGKLAVGGLLALAVPPFVEIERGFYKSSAVLFLLAAYSMTLGESYLLAKYANLHVVSPSSLALWVVFTAAFSAYTATLFVDLPFLRARLFPTAVITGFASLTATAWSYAPSGASFIGGAPFALSALSGAAVLGAATTGMLLGHWYLIESGLDLSPLRRIFAFCRGCLRIEIVCVCAAALLLWLLPGQHWSEAFSATSERFYPLVIGRGVAWGLALLIVELIGRTLAIPQTMAATGLFYMEALVVAVGEICGHWLLFRSGLPL